MNTQELAAAIAAAEQNARNRPDDFNAFEQLGHAYFEANRYDAAKAAFQRAIELNPRSAHAFEASGHIEYRLDNPPAAIEAYEKSIAIDPSYTIAYFGLGILHATKTGDYELAIDAYRRGLAANPGDPFLTAHLGGTYARMGQIDKAIDLLERAARSNPDDPFAWGWLNMLYLHQRRLEDTLDACRRLNAIQDDHSGYRLIGFVYREQGRMAEAAQALERSIEVEPDDYEARAALARVYLETGRAKEAEMHYRQALETARANDGEYGLACSYAVYGDVDQALALLETALAQGQVMPGWARIDPEFAFIQDDPRFRALIGQPLNI